MFIQSRLPGLLFLCLFLTYGCLSQDIQLDFWAEEELFNARTFPVLIALGGSFLSLLYLLFPPAMHINETPEINWRLFNWELVALVVLMCLYAALIEPLGFLVATTFFLGTGSLLLGERRPLRLVVVSLSVTASFYAIMTFLEIRLPQGHLVADLIETSQGVSL